MSKSGGSKCYLNYFLKQARAQGEGIEPTYLMHALCERPLEFRCVHQRLIDGQVGNESICTSTLRVSLN